METNKDAPLFAKDDDVQHRFDYRKCETVEELAQYIKELTTAKLDYNTCGYAITKALLATEMLLAHVIGTTGFQHGYAQMAYLQETRSSKTGMMVINLDDLLYPQYDPIKKLQGYIDDVKKEQLFLKEVNRLLDEHPRGKDCSPTVYNHWLKLAGKQHE